MTENDDLPRFSSRPHLWLRPNQPLVCPNLLNGYPHKLSTNWSSMRDGQDDVVQCEYRRQRDAALCGAFIYVISFPGGSRYTTRVKLSEVIDLRGKHHAHEILEYLSSTNPFPE